MTPVPDCIGPSSPAVWNRLSVAQVDAMDALLRKGIAPVVIARTIGARLEDVAAVLANRRKLP